MKLICKLKYFIYNFILGIFGNEIRISIHIWWCVCDALNVGSFNQVSVFPYLISRYKTSASAMTVVGLWSVLFGGRPMFFQSTLMVASLVCEHTCRHESWIVWAVSRKVLGWKRLNKNWLLSKEVAVALFQVSQAALPDHLCMVNLISSLHWTFSPSSLYP